MLLQRRGIVADVFEGARCLHDAGAKFRKDGMPRARRLSVQERLETAARLTDPDWDRGVQISGYQLVNAASA